MSKRTRSTTERINSLEQSIAKQEASLNATIERLKAEKKRQFASDMKKIEKICAKGNITFEKIIDLATAIVDSGTPIDEVITAYNGKTKSDNQEDNNSEK